MRGGFAGGGYCEGVLSEAFSFFRLRNPGWLLHCPWHVRGSNPRSGSIPEIHAEASPDTTLGLGVLVHLLCRRPLLARGMVREVRQSLDDLSPEFFENQGSSVVGRKGTGRIIAPRVPAPIAIGRWAGCYFMLFGRRKIGNETKVVSDPGVVCQFCNSTSIAYQRQVTLGQKRKYFCKVSRSRQRRDDCGRWYRRP